MNNFMGGDPGFSGTMVINFEPGKRADPFVLGSDIRDALAIISSDKWRNIITKTVIKYDLGKYRNTQILLDLTQNGVLLRFDGRTQKLVSVEVYSFQHINLSFCGELFSNSSFGSFSQYMDDGAMQQSTDDVFPSRGRSTIPTFAEIYRLFRPTYPGAYDFRDDLITYTLNYPGISFIFVIPENWRALAHELEQKKDHPIEFPDKSSPQVMRICLCPPVDEKGQPIAITPDLSSSDIAASDGAVDEKNPSCDKNKSCADVKKQFVEVRLLDGLYFDDGSAIKLGDSAQDVISVLGEPDDQFIKPKEQMLSNRSGSSASVPQRPQDVFYNYFRCGIDILLDGKSFTVKKFVLHANYPHHKDFGRYSKSIWRLSVPQTLPEGVSEDDANREVNVDSTWTEVKSAFAPSETSGQPLVNSASSAESPFGTTYFHAYEEQCVIFEVMQNDFIASLSFFRL